jgi:hypothetical protein
MIRQAERDTQVEKTILNWDIRSIKPTRRISEDGWCPIPAGIRVECAAKALGVAVI